MVNDIAIIAIVGGLTGVTTVLFGFGGGFVVVPFVYQLFLRQPVVANHALHIAVATSAAVMIFNAGWATYNPQRRRNLSANILFPLTLFIGLGAVMGSLLAGQLSEAVIRLLFIFYMLVTIIDCLVSRHFLKGSEARPLSALTTTVGGTAIGTVAALLGVGGSVMTVPLLRKHGFSMKDCISHANPLSLPVALCATITYTINGWGKIPVSGFLGYISLTTLAILIVTGGVGISISQRYLPKIADGWHARLYVLLLIAVLVAMFI
ncbi:sulfite exporter TauE/SafE family protein [Rosenbergiella nectarea]|uniref:sulfite exporter TauE/SafE family protein n=1 Tax=Rosenbergiella nectarea TaxID=988801 RepID=UPI001BDA3B8E|nr:sulfite exporter TauE/SafE family protein [Rosenbergiella nectarea]MBT0729799.1 sulfite exporter TauE/SafE family protein [Rosenbergiella nectarea subsp. apis]